MSLDALAEHVGMTRPGLMKLLADNGERRTMPKSTTAVAIAEAFGVDVRDLMENDPSASLRAVLDAFERAPIRRAAKVPDSEVRVFGRKVQTAGEEAGVVPIKRRGGRK